jgi:hypothetical protein
MQKYKIGNYLSFSVKILTRAHTMEAHERRPRGGFEGGHNTEILLVGSEAELLVEREQVGGG